MQLKYKGKSLTFLNKRTTKETKIPGSLLLKKKKKVKSTQSKLNESSLGMEKLW